mmetsp:Transcript_71698/g.201132  ORF Transcript_71698/g.201132 Transcript_71698/m.201132 type:complete len:398 (-) Transcript_71698:125-1318(-)
MPRAKRACGTTAQAKAPAEKQQQQRGGAAKRQRVVDPLEQKCASVLAGLRDAVIPADVAKMLNAMLGHALKDAREDRHSIQASVVDMTGDVMSEAEAQMAEKVAAMSASIAALEEVEVARQGAVSEAGSVVSAADGVTQGRKRSLAEAAQEFQGRRRAVQAAQAEAAAARRRLEETAARKAGLQEAQASYLQPLKEGDQDEAKKRDLLEVLRPFQVDSSILAALPNAIGKPPSQRGPFDTMVLVQLEADLAKRAEALEAELRSGGEAVSAAEAAERAAAAALAEAQQRQLESAQDFKAATAERDRAKAAFDAASGELCAVYPEMRRRTKDRVNTEKRLEGFREGPLAAFVELRDRSKPALEEAQAACEGAGEGAVAASNDAAKEDVAMAGEEATAAP